MHVSGSLVVYFNMAERQSYFLGKIINVHMYVKHKIIYRIFETQREKNY